MTWLALEGLTWAVQLPCRKRNPNQYFLGLSRDGNRGWPKDSEAPAALGSLPLLLPYTPPFLESLSKSQDADSAGRRISH